MSLLSKAKIIYNNLTLKNTEPNTIEEAGISTGGETNSGESFDLIEKVPFLIKRTIKNCRFASKDSTVKGILNDTIIKTIGTFVIEGDTPEAVEYIQEQCKPENWDISQLMEEILWAGMVDGESFIELPIKDNHITPRILSFDAENYRVKKIYDEYGQILGYKQLTKRNKDTNKGWLAKKFDELSETLEEIIVDYTPAEIINPKYMERRSKGQSLIMDALDLVFHKRSLEVLMLKTTYKNTNIMKVTMGNSDASNMRLTEEDMTTLENEVNNYHNKGVVTVPYGIDLEMINGGDLKSIPDYIKYFKTEIYTVLMTPETAFSNENGTYALGKMQNDSKTTGRAVLLDYNREWLKKYIENELFRPELDMNGFTEVNVWIDFNPTIEDDSSAYLETSDQKENREDKKLDENLKEEDKVENLDDSNKKEDMNKTEEVAQ